MATEPVIVLPVPLFRALLPILQGQGPAQVKGMNMWAAFEEEPTVVHITIAILPIPLRKMSGSREGHRRTLTPRITLTIDSVQQPRMPVLVTAIVITWIYSLERIMSITTIHSRPISHWMASISTLKLNKMQRSTYCQGP